MKTFFLDGKSYFAEQSILTIYFGQEHFSFSVYEPQKTGSFYFKELFFDVQRDVFSVFKEKFFENDLFSFPFRKVIILYRTPVFTFVPNKIYNDIYKEDFMQFMFSEKEGLTLTHSISSSGIQVLYKIPENIHSFILRSFVKPEIIHYSTPFITFFTEKIEKTDDCRMIVNMKEKGIDIFCFSKETLLLGNYFPCKSIQEMVYFILFTWKQLQLSQLNDSLNVAGNSDLKYELIDLVSPYIQNIYNLSVFTEKHFDGIDTEIIPFELATLSSCGL